LGTILAPTGAELWLSWLNRRHVLAHRARYRKLFRSRDEALIKVREYTLAESAFGSIEEIYGAVVLLVILSAEYCRSRSTFFAHHHGTSA